MNQTEMGVAASWDPGLIVLSYVVAVFASYTALDLAGRARTLWLAGGAFAMGTGFGLCISPACWPSRWRCR